MRFRLFATVATIGLAGGLGISGIAAAQAPPAPAPAPAPAAAPSTAWDLGNGISMSGHAEFGTSLNPDTPDNNINFGQTFTDQADTVRMNQLMLNVERDLDPKNADYQWGFKFTGMYGTDARVTHFLGELDRITHGPYQLDIVELDAQSHIPWIGGGTDVKLGQYPTPLGAEVIDATGNQFYSHSYIFNFGLPFKHTGILTTTHVTDMLDVWAGLDTGSNNSIGDKGMANNYFPKLLGGVGLNNLLDGNLTVLALAHIGPENPRFVETTNFAAVQPAGPITAIPGANSKSREFVDIVTTYKISDSLTTTNELNYIHDDLAGATGGGAAQYINYTLTDQWSVGARVEAFADQGKAGTNGFGGFACVAQEPLDYVNAQRGLAPSLAYCGSLGNYNVVYGEVTLGATYKPALSDQFNVMIRPEFRVNSVVGGSNIKPFNVSNTSFGSGAAGTNTGTTSTQYTLAVDLIVGF